MFAISFSLTFPSAPASMAAFRFHGAFCAFVLSIQAQTGADAKPKGWFGKPEGIDREAQGDGWIVM
jgi:hypothetical protein